MAHVKKNRKTDAKQNPEWIAGTLCGICKEKSIFIRPSKPLPETYNKSKDVYLHSSKTSKYALPLKRGDKGEFVLGIVNKEKPEAQKFRATVYGPRTYEELLDYFDQYTEVLKSTDCKNALLETLSNTAMWKFLGSPSFASDDHIMQLHYTQEFLHLLQLILRVGKQFKNHLELVMKTVVQGVFFSSSRDGPSLVSIIKQSNYTSFATSDLLYVRDTHYSISDELIKNFCIDVVRQVPAVSRCLLPVVRVISEEKSDASSFLFEFLSLALSGDSSMVSNEDVWQDLPFIPTDNELAGSLVQEDRHLSKVRNTYSSSETYMDTYFRLLRAETFSAIQIGIKQFKESKLDKRDMNVYHHVRLAGFQIQNGRFSLVVQFTSDRPVKSWKSCSRLMFGNLICISFNKKFDDVIWAVVANRDEDMLYKHQIITLDLIEDNNKKMSDVFSSLQAHAAARSVTPKEDYLEDVDKYL
ncbi:uncharacterized protein LOC124442968 isoform X2 [Xenia sp. Carnegie-2017]|nr:uncharacterized protein LOC124442968 isoform X2 [Xenia sp. Carnegie-2017]